MARATLLKIIPSLGMNNVLRPTRLPGDRLWEAQNVEVGPTGAYRRRLGYAKRLSLVGARSITAYAGRLIVVANGQLVSIDPLNYEQTVKASGFSTDLFADFAEVNGKLYWSNEDTNGVLVGGVSRPVALQTPGIPYVEAVSGSLVAGTYLVAVSALWADGEISGASYSFQIDLASPGGIRIVRCPIDPLAAKWRVWISKPNGTTLYAAADVDAVETEFVFTGGLLGMELKYGGLAPLPPGQLICANQGRLWVARDNEVWYSEPLLYGLYDPRKNVLPPFPARITLLEPVQDGLFIGADKTYFVQWNKEEVAPQIQVVSTRKVVEGTGVVVRAEDFDLNGVTGAAAFWVTEQDGPTVGLPGGQVVFLTRKDVAIDRFARGTTLLREQQGFRQLIMSLADRQAKSGFSAGDSATIDVIKGGAR